MNQLPTCSIQRRHTLTQLYFTQEAIDEMNHIKAFNDRPVITKEDLTMSMVLPVLAFVCVIGLFFI